MAVAVAVVGRHSAPKRSSGMAIVRWIELKCDGCNAVLDGLHFEGDTDGPLLREAAKRCGWTRIKTEDGFEDRCSDCRREQ